MSNQKLQTRDSTRRTFAIISHPDAGKTTITEQLLLFGGVVRQAGTVKARKTGNFAKSDWMEIEQKRGISVTSSVMQFDYGGKRINILDTPGHADFSEDTYRTLMAVDSAVMVIDSAKGIEPQTKKLFQICKMRGIPIFTFMNKLDRDGRDPMDLIDELETVLGVQAYPMNWPIGMGKTLEGIFDRYNHRVELYTHAQKSQMVQLDDNNNPINNAELADDDQFQETKDSIDLLDMAGNKFDEDKIATGDLTPVFFGSALVNFGVKTFFDAYLKYAPAPSAHKTQEGDTIQPDADRFSGFVFKIQANMNPNHRDRIAFVRICSGEFEKGMDVNLYRTQKKLRLSNVTEFMANTRENVNTAVAGDIIGLYDTGNFQIGDTIYTGKAPVEFEKLPQFTPELFVRVSAKNVMKQKSFHKGIDQLVQEGAVQLYTSYTTNDYILGAVGQLQFEVFQFRMKNEYNSDVNMEPMGHKIARWIDPDQLDEKMSSSRNLLVKDRTGQPLFLFENTFAMRWFKDKYPDVTLTAKL
ncbi:MAG: peptide chain release factor 3 [Lentilactobacillus hilgardii]|jgi:peptide chain release factor 3|uniref:Peptide chain release factor 3 n=1 Tax=Lentilactobacillus hilgardii TaxID=1588 RepID=A0A6P1E5N6_LENHI|nr:peptide chain release factor 3 [Lentilactobacillus hilgardii]RRG10263.1 MAG: peptide chain release factor 3 [Lactobacillus sp.]EEI70583.1 peptide chain release factor 3 [Lentilactobacillus hilgardii ATCC 27305]MBZ2202218.1 peptide chain release factor 3 [Lentilactobacillus hilgardii]MBZ2205199.1 peptide chain release factor 3 [Lentilactobacillus hilgardii]MCT3392779.1 peptide chain release factor 3 [Lentilactobacillus hilgardii]